MRITRSYPHFFIAKAWYLNENCLYLCLFCSQFNLNLNMTNKLILIYTQLHAGYILQPVYKELTRLVAPPETTGVDKLQGLYHHLCAFDVFANFEQTSVVDKPEWAVLANLVSRGLPTFAGLDVEETFAEAFGRTVKKADEGEVGYESLFEPEEVKHLFSALHLVDPRWKAEPDEERLESSFEKDFVQLLAASDRAYLLQLLDAQRELTTIASAHCSDLLAKQRVDFAIENPYYYLTTMSETGYLRRGTVVEVDGEPYHSDAAQRAHDEFRERAVASVGWTTVRIKSLSDDKLLEPVCSGDYMAHVKWCWQQEMKEEAHARTLQMALTPFAVARIQKVITEAVLAGKLDPAKKRWVVFVCERDVPCAALAFRNLALWYNHLMELKGSAERFPEIDLELVSTSEFSDSPLHLNIKPRLKTSKEVLKKHYDLTLDISVLRRSGIENQAQLAEELPTADVVFLIRSSHTGRSSRKMQTGKLIVYQPLVIKSGGRYQEIETTRRTLDFFLQNLFRKQAFRDGQVPIIDRALRCESVIGLLPTGGGKSLTYQLAALLQPGISLVVDPLRSLMKDQYDGLLRVRIDCCAYINSDIEVEARNRIQRQMTDSEWLFVFVSPERLTVPDFREVLDEMFRSEIFFAYGVIDEVHCVSEWGHDFRTSYLHLGMNLRRFARCKEGVLPMFGLTATASFDVLADVERELAGMGALLGSDAIVRFENTNRLELQYKVEKVIGQFRKKSVPDVKTRAGEEIAVERVDVRDLKDIKEAVGLLKTQQLKPFVKNVPRLIDELQASESLQRIASRFNERIGAAAEGKGLAVETLQVEPEELFLKRLPGREEYRYAGILFCPHKKGVLGVRYIKDDIEDIADDVGLFMGGEDSLLARECLENQRLFKENKLAVMVATKAFGMGIDKPNVRYTVNVNYPSSLESFVQEAGRAGRDRKMALATILYSDTQLVRIVGLNKPEGWQKSGDAWNWQALERIKYAWFMRQDLEDLLQRLELTDFVESNSAIELEAYDPDYEVPLFFFNQAFPGEEKEKTVFNELLEKIDTPVGEHQEGEATRLFEDSIFASLDAHEEGEAYTLPVPMSNSLAAPAEMIKKIGRVLNMQLSEAQVEYLKLALGDKMKMHTAEEVLDRLLRRIDLPCDALQFGPYCLTKGKGRVVFPNPFADYQTKECIRAHREEIEELFNRLRDKPATDKAIYRMVCIGLIDDFTIDYNKDLYQLSLVRKAPGSYFAALQEFYGRYYSQDAAHQRVKHLKASDIKEEIRICLEELTHFIYDKTMKKRRRAMDDMKAFCVNGVMPGRDWKESNEELKDYLYYYFNSKYARQGNETESGEPYSLLDDTEGGKRSAFPVVQKYMKVTDDRTDVSGTPVDNIKHLQGAIRLIRRSLVKENPSLQMLNAFCLFFLGTEGNEALTKERNEDFYNGFVTLYEEAEPVASHEGVIDFLDAFCRQVSEEGNVQEREEVVTYLAEAREQLLFLVHSQSMSDITDKYINNANQELNK